jgi:hypothetical protein
MIEKLYGKAVFYEDAANAVLQETYDDAAKESGEEIVSRPQIDVTQVEEGKPFIYTATVALKPEVTLGQYLGVEVPKKEITVSEEEINADMVDRTNVPNPHQGTIRYGQLDEKALLKRIREDFDSVQLPRKCRIRRTLAVTHENEYPGRVIAMGDYVSDGESRDSVKLQ